MVALNCQRQNECGYPNGQQCQSSNQNSRFHKDLRCWLVDGVHRSDIDRQSTKFLLIHISRRVLS